VIKFVFTENYESILSRIEDYIFETTNSLNLIEKFLEEHDQTLNFIAQNPKTPAIHPVTGDQSWVFGDGRYRLFFRCIENKETITVYLTHLIDNKEINLDIYPENKIPTYDEE
jgi:hypothetical protein